MTKGKVTVSDRVGINIHYFWGPGRSFGGRYNTHTVDPFLLEDLFYLSGT